MWDISSKLMLQRRAVTRGLTGQWQRITVVNKAQYQRACAEKK
jgi:hypothetical protein